MSDHQFPHILTRDACNFGNIAQAVQAAFDGDEFIVCSLRTGERRVAAQRARLKLIETDAAFDAARQKQSGAPSADVSPFKAAASRAIRPHGSPSRNADTPVSTSSNRGAK